MNPAQIDARVVMSSQMFGIVEIHVDRGRLQPAPTKFQSAQRRGGGGRAIGLP